MAQSITKQTFDNLGPDLFGCLTALHTLAEGLDGLGGLVFGLVEIAEHSEVSQNSLHVLMEQIFSYADTAKDAEEALLALSGTTG